MSTSRRSSLIDQELLRSLEQAFAAHAGEDALIDAAELQRALGLKSEYLAKRVLRMFDRDGSGKVDRAEFLAAVRGVVFGDERMRLEFVFRLHDDDGDGSLSEQETHRMIAISLAESDVISRRSQPPERLARAVFEAADVNRDGRISFDEFARVLGRYPDLLRKMTRSEALWIAPNEAVLARLTAADAPRAEPRWSRFVQNHALDLLFVLGWAVLNGALAVWGSRFDAVAAGSGWVRAGYALALCLSFNGALVFVPVLRHFVARVRRTWLGRRIAVDDAVDVHRVLGQLLFALAVLHATAYVVGYAHGHARLGVMHLFTHMRGASGAILFFVLAVLWLFAQEPIRRSQRFELFYNTHRLYLVFALLLIVHAPHFLLWGALPLLGLAAELVMRRRRRARSTDVLELVALRSGVTRLVLERPAGFQFDPADYVFLNIPELAKHEWHPFTLSSAPEEEALGVHVRSLGNWTSALRRLAEARETAATEPLRARIDGPYGTPTARIFQSRHAVLIGAGIGVTPFAGVLGSIVARAEGQSASASALEHVHFFWLNRDQYSFEWFTALLETLERKRLPIALDLHICMTGGKTGSTAAALEIARAILHEQGRRDLVTGLRAKTHMGHPDWPVVLAAIADQHAPEPVDVFFCGPRSLAQTLRASCERTGMRFHEEKF